MSLVRPFLALISWALFGEAYQAVTIVLLMALFYLLPKKSGRERKEGKGISP